MAMKPGNGGGGNGERDARLDALYRDAPRVTPPSHLDAAILAAARREVAARPRPLSAQLQRWRLPLSIAAVVVLSASLVTLVGEKSQDPLLSELRSAAGPSMTRTEEPPEQPADPAKAPEDRQRAPTATPEAFSLQRDEAAAKAPAESNAVMERERARPGAGPAAEPDAGAARAAGDVGGMVSSQARESPQRPRADAPTPHAPSTGVRGPDTAPPVAAPQPKPLADRRMQAEQAPAMKRPPVWHGLEQEPPQKWLERLAELKRQGRPGEAQELLAELKRRFPDYPLPSGVE